MTYQLRITFHTFQNYSSCFYLIIFLMHFTQYTMSRTHDVNMYIRLYEQNYFISKLFMITYDRVLVSGRGWMHRILVGFFLRIGIPTFLRVAMLWNRACRVNRVMENLANFEIRFMICEELLPMFKTLCKKERTVR
jgi:hypothetical protein